MLYNTRGIVLRTVKYGETSIIATIYTELFGLQSYLINGVRTAGKKGHGKANMFQPPTILDLVVYHQSTKNLHRIKEYKWAVFYQTVSVHVLQNTVALYIIELLLKTIKQPESNTDLYYFIEDIFLHLDNSTISVVANLPLFFAIHLSSFLGWKIVDNYSNENTTIDLQEGKFVAERPTHAYYLQGQLSYVLSQLLKIMQPKELEQLHLNQQLRQELLLAFQKFYTLHIPEFGNMKTLPILHEVLAVS